MAIEKTLCANCNSRVIYPVQLPSRVLWLHKDTDTSVCRWEKGWHVAAKPE